MGNLILISVLRILVLVTEADATSPVPQGFPARWDGDRHFHSQCEVVQKPPTWLDGYFFCQLCASYGDPASEEGQHVDHMFDAIGAVAVFDVSPEKTTFTGAYYPSRSYKIWNFYDRDFAQSSVAWKPYFAKLNVSAHKLWENILPEWVNQTPNIDFWKIHNDIIAGTELYPVGFTFNVDTVDHFRYYPFKEAAPTMLGQPLVPIHMAIHERMDPETGLLWATVSALDISKKPPSFHQVLFTIDEDGVRRVEGVFDYSPWNPSKCQPDGFYAYDAKSDFFPRNMHSITSTQRYVILPLTSLVFNPCLLLKGPKSVDFSFRRFYKFDCNTPVSFLIFDKRSKKFLPSVLKYESKSQFISHQFNAFEISDTLLVADVISYDEHAYNAWSRKRLIQPSGTALSRVYRYTLDLKKKLVTAESIAPDGLNLEFPQFNHNFEGKPYKFGYAVTHVYYAGNSIVKIDTTDPSGTKNRSFKPRNSETISLLEPSFVQRPGSNDEDDGVVVSRGYDTTLNKTRVYVLDAKSMKQVGEILAPTDTPFGFHERFYLRESFHKRSDKQTKHKVL